jgi:CheY-like chemotaxis protein
LVAHDGGEGVAAARELRPDIVVMDLQMPRMDGYDLERLLERSSHSAAGDPPA